MTKTDSTVERVGAYRVVRKLATGGTSDVLLAKAEGPHGFERTVVLKILLSEFRNDDQLSRMFAREASAYARLTHPAIVSLFDFFSITPDEKDKANENKGFFKAGREEQLVMVLEHVDGPALSRLRSMLKAIGRELDDKAAIFIASRVFDALAAAHATTDDAGNLAPVIHRDVNPSNVLVPWDGQVKLADFGVAKVTDLKHESVAGMIKGTYGYMAPEQVTGELVTPRADVYAGAIILWELLTKRRAFQRGALPEVEALRAMAEPRLTSLDAARPDIDKAVRDAVRRALEPRAERRTITAEEMAAILASVVKPDEGRERLVSILSVVRADARAAAAVAPPNEPSLPRASISAGPITQEDPHTIQAAVAPPPTQTGLAPPAGGSPLPAPVPPPRGMLPKPAGPPRPQSVPRLTAAFDTTGADKVPPKPPSSNKLPSPEPPKVVKHATTLLDGSSAGQPKPARSPLATMGTLQSESEPNAPTKRPSAAHRLTAVGPDGKPLTLVKHEDKDNSKDKAKNEEPGKAGPQHAITRNLKLGEAIEEALRGQQLGVPDAKSELKGGAILMTSVGVDRPIGQIPAAPAPLSPTPPETPSDEARSPLTIAGPIQDFQASLKEVGEAPTMPPTSEAPALEPAAPATPRMLKHTVPMKQMEEGEGPLPILFSPVPPPPGPMQAELAAFEATAVLYTPSAPATAAASAGPPAQPAHAPPTPPTPGFPPPQPAGTPALALASTMVASSENSGGGPIILPNPNAHTPAYHRPTPANQATVRTVGKKKGFGVGTVAALLVMLIGVGIAGTILYARFQGTGILPFGTTFGTTATAPPPATTTKPTPTTPAAPPSLVPSARQTGSAVAASSVEPVGSATPSVSASASPSAAPSASVASPTASASGQPVPPTTNPSSTPPSGSPTGNEEGTGTLKTTGAAPGRRIFVDDKVVGQTPDSVTVKCGQHFVRLGSTGKYQTIDVPCAGEVTVSDKF